MARRLADCRRTTPPGSGRTWQMSSKSAQAVKDLENRFFIQRKVYQALVRSRLYSSGALVIGVDQGNPEEELDLDKVGQGRQRLAARRWNGCGRLQPRRATRRTSA